MVTAHLRVYLQGEVCTHILVELLTHLSFSTSAKAEMLHVGIVETLVSVFPVLRGIAQRDVLQLLDRVTTEDAPVTRQYRPGQRLCRMPCVRLVFSVLGACAGADREHPPPAETPQCLTPAISLLDKITDAIVTAQATQAAGQLMGRAGASWERSPAGRAAALIEELAPQLLSLLAAVAAPCGDEAASGRASTHVATSGRSAHLGRMVARIQFRVQRWCSETRQQSKTPKTQDVQKCVTTTEPVEMNTGRN